MQRLPFSPIQNSAPPSAVGLGSFFSKNVSAFGGKLRPITGYTEVRPPNGRKIVGMLFAEYQNNSEYIIAEVDTQFPQPQTYIIRRQLDGTETTLYTENGDDDWYFVQFGEKIFAVASSGTSLFSHTIGTNDWAGASLPQKPDVSNVNIRERWFTSPGFPIRSWGSEILNGLTLTARVGVFTRPLAMARTSDPYVYYITPTSGWSGTVNDNSSPFELDFSWDAANYKDITWNDVFYFSLLRLFLDGSFASSYRPLEARLIDSNDREATLEFYQWAASVGGSTKYQANVYVLDLRVASGSSFDRGSLKRVILKFENRARYALDWGNYFFALALMRGDIWQNDTRGSVSLTDGPRVDKREYKFVYQTTVGFSPASDVVESTDTPSGSYGFRILGSYTEVTIPRPQDWGNPLTPQNGDKLLLFRKAKDSGTWHQVEELTYDSTSGLWEDSDGVQRQASSTDAILFRDHLMEDDLTLNATMPDDAAVITAANSIGLFRSSLVIGSHDVEYGPLVYISRANQPMLFEPPGAAPRPDDYWAGRTVFARDNRAQAPLVIIGTRALFLGYRDGWYAMIGDSPTTLSPPVAIDYVGVVGPRAAAPFQDGVVYANRNGVFFLRLVRPLIDEPGARQSQELTTSVAQLVEWLGLDENAVVAIWDGDIYVFSGNRGAYLDKRDGGWVPFEYPKSVVAAISHPSIGLVFASDDGGLYAMGGDDFAGTPIQWEYDTGEYLPEVRSRLAKLGAIVNGSPLIDIFATQNNWNESPKQQTVQLSEETIFPSYQPGLSVGSKFSLKIRGTGNDSVDSILLEFSPVGGGGARAS